jgi:hypothetical protein
VKPTREFLDSLLVTSCTDLFTAYGVRLTPRSSAQSVPGDPWCGGLVSFASSGLSGTLLLAGSFEFFANTRPPETRGKALSISSSADWLIVRDWSMELVNQLFGRMRNRMYQYDMRLNAKAPTAVSGGALEVAIRLRTSAPTEFMAPDGKVMRAWLDGQVSPSLFPPAAPSSETAGNLGDASGASRSSNASNASNAKEGDVLLF